MWGRHIPGTTENTIVTIFCTSLSVSFSANLVTQTMQPPKNVRKKEISIHVDIRNALIY